MIRSAIISSCGTYRYQLLRAWGGPDGDEGMAFIMLNPSTADGETDDPTIRRCIGFAQRERHDGILVANLYALRATDPKVCMAHPLRTGGAENDAHLVRVASRCQTIVCAWGANAEPERARHVLGLLRGNGASVMCLGMTKDGHPRHPLYLRADVPLVPFTGYAA